MTSPFDSDFRNMGLQRGEWKDKPVNSNSLPKTVDWAIDWADAMHCDERESQEALEILAAEVRKLRAVDEPS